MTFKINGTTIAQPEQEGWLSRDILGIDGNGKPIYPAIRDFEFRWGLMSLSDFCELQTLYNTQGTTGTVVVELPYFCTGSWTFQPYSGTIMREPQPGRFFEEYYTDVYLLITGIRTQD